MDERIRAAERSGDRRRYLIECKRAGLPFQYQIGDTVRLLLSDGAWVNNGSLKDIADAIRGKEAVITEVYGKSGWGMVRIEMEELKQFFVTPGLNFWFHEVEPA